MTDTPENAPEANEAVEESASNDAVEESAGAESTAAAAEPETASTPFPEAAKETPTAPVVSSGAPGASRPAPSAADKAPTVPGAPQTAGTPISMGGFASGELVKGTVTKIDKNEIELDLGDGKVGVIGSRHWTSGLIVDLSQEVKEGDRVEGAVLARTDPRQRTVLSRVWARQKRAWEAVEQAKRSNETLTAIVTDSVKGGLAVSIDGLRGFLPASLVDEGNVEDLDQFLKQKIDVRVLEADRGKARLLVSRKAALRAQARAQAKEAMTELEVGTELEGTVVQITDFGAFVDVNGIRGLVHRSEMGWGRSSDPSHEVSVGDTVKVKVVKVQPKKNRLGLSMRVGDDPLKNIKVGDRLQGPISRLVDFGVFVEVAPGLEGLVHVSEMADYRVFQPEEVVMPGDVVAVKVLGVDKKRRTIDLSMREAFIPELNIEVPGAEAAADAGDSEDSAGAEE